MAERDEKRAPYVRRRVGYWVLAGVVTIAGGVVVGVMVSWAVSAVVVTAAAPIWVGIPPGLTALGFSWNSDEPAGMLGQPKPALGPRLQSPAAPSPSHPASFESESPDASPALPCATDDLVRLADLLPDAITSTLTIRQLARQAGLPGREIAAEEVSAVRVWPDVIESARRRGALHPLLRRIKVNIEGRVDVAELRDLINRLLAG